MATLNYYNSNLQVYQFSFYTENLALAISIRQMANKFCCMTTEGYSELEKKYKVTFSNDDGAQFDAVMTYIKILEN